MTNLGLLAAALLASSASAADFDVPPAPAPQAPVWVTYDDVSAPVKTPVEMLPVISERMHQQTGRCAGFLAHESEAAARASMRPASVKVGGPYTLDSQAVAGPLAASVSESNIRGTISSLAAFNNRFYQSDTGVAAAGWIASQWRAVAAKVPGASVELVTHANWKQPSVVLTIPGSEKPEEIVVLGGHLDSINGWGNASARAPGADDNASGIAVLTETARALADGGFRPKRTVQFMGYAAEEVGLRGSQDIAGRYAAAGKKVVGVIQFDMSNFAGSGDKIFLLTDNVDKTLSDFTGRLIDAYSGVTWETTECGYGCSDHASWTKRGYPASMAFEASFEGMNHKIHTAEDTLATSGGDAKHSVPFAKLAVGFAVELAKPTAAKSGAAAGR